MDQIRFRPIPALPISKSKTQSVSTLGQGFNQHLQQAVASTSTNGKLTISKHAQIRINQRNIDIDSATWSKIESKVQQAREMGVTESLVLTENEAMIVSVKNNTVITAMNRQEASAQIFTNINGTILID